MPQKHIQNAQIIRGLHQTGQHKRPANGIPTRQIARNERTQTLRKRLDNIEEAHDGRSLLGEDDGGQEGGAGRRVHACGAVAEDEEGERWRERVGEGDEGEEDGGGEVREYHCLFGGLVSILEEDLVVVYLRGK